MCTVRYTFLRGQSFNDVCFFNQDQSTFACVFFLRLGQIILPYFFNKISHRNGFESPRRFLHFNYIILGVLFFTYVQMRLLHIIGPSLSFNLNTPALHYKVQANLQQFCIQCVSQAEFKPFLYFDYSICIWRRINFAGVNQQKLYFHSIFFPLRAELSSA